MGIFASYEWLVAYLQGFLAHLIRIGIPYIMQRRVSRIAIVEGKEIWVNGHYSVIHSLYVWAHSTFVAETPEDDAGMILVALHERDGSVHVSILPCRVFTHVMVGIAIAMALLVGLVHDIHAIAVAEFVEIGTVRVVACAQEVDVGTLHESYVLLVGGVVDIPSCARMVVVSVDTLQLHVLPVDLEYLAHDLRALHSEMVVEVLGRCASLVSQFHAEGVEMRLGSRPQSGTLHPVVELYRHGVAGCNLLDIALDVFAVYVEGDVDSLGHLLASVAYLDVSLDRCFPVVLARRGLDPVVRYVNEWAHPHLHGAEDAAQSPHVLTFEITAVAPSVHLHSQAVLALAEISCDVKLCRRHGVLAVSNLPTVDPHVHG